MGEERGRRGEGSSRFLFSVVETAMGTGKSFLPFLLLDINTSTIQNGN